MQTPGFLRTIPLFGNLTDPELGLVGKALDEITLPDGARPIEEGKPHGRLYVIKEGHVELKGRGDDGQERTLAVLRPGEGFGECALTPNAPSLITVEVVMGPVQLLSLEGEAVKRLVRLKPEIGIGLLAAAFTRIQHLQRMAVLQG